MTGPSRDNVKRIITGIVQQAGGVLPGKTRLFKAFYIAHLLYWRDHEGTLTTHPMIRMPQGPGIGSERRVFRELEKEGWLHVSKRRVGRHQEFVFETAREVQLSDAEADAISQALSGATNVTGKQLSDWSHEFSRAWKLCSNGEPLPIYMDLPSDVEMAEVEEHLDRSQAIVDDLFPSQSGG